MCTDAVPADLPRRDSLTVPIRSQFFESLGATSWRTRSAAPGVEWVITHGQLHTANVLRANSGVPMMIDRDCVALAPRERDLDRHWGGLAEPKTREDWAAYTSAGVGAGVNASAVELYWHIGLLWGLCVSTGALQPSHVDDPDTRRMWTMLQSLLSEAGEASSWRRR